MRLNFNQNTIINSKHETLLIHDWRNILKWNKILKSNNSGDLVNENTERWDEWRIFFRYAWWWQMRKNLYKNAIYSLHQHLHYHHTTSPACFFIICFWPKKCQVSEWIVVACDRRGCRGKEASPSLRAEEGRPSYNEC